MATSVAAFGRSDTIRLIDTTLKHCRWSVAVEIGVTVVGADWIRQHRRHGGTSCTGFLCTTGEQAQCIEQGVLTLLMSR